MTKPSYHLLSVALIAIQLFFSAADATITYQAEESIIEERFANILLNSFAMPFPAAPSNLQNNSEIAAVGWATQSISLIQMDPQYVRQAVLTGGSVWSFASRKNASIGNGDQDYITYSHWFMNDLVVLTGNYYLRDGVNKVYDYEMTNLYTNETLKVSLPEQVESGNTTIFSRDKDGGHIHLHSDFPLVGPTYWMVSPTDRNVILKWKSNDKIVIGLNGSYSKGLYPNILINVNTHEHVHVRSSNDSTLVESGKDAIVFRGIAMTDINIANQGEVAHLSPGKEFSVRATYEFLSDKRQGNGNESQIIVGYAGIGPTVCVVALNYGYEFKARDRGDKDVRKDTRDFVMKAPTEPGVYDIRFNLTNVYSVNLEALNTTWTATSPPADATIGIIIVE